VSEREEREMNTLTYLMNNSDEGRKRKKKRRREEEAFQKPVLGGTGCSSP